jgi:hypothetical protein
VARSLRRASVAWLDGGSLARVSGPWSSSCSPRRSAGRRRSPLIVPTTVAPGAACKSRAALHKYPR